MSNELKINRLLEYEVDLDNDLADRFTADSHSFNPTSNMFEFYRTGNTIREYRYVNKIVIKPVEE